MFAFQCCIQMLVQLQSFLYSIYQTIFFYVLSLYLQVCNELNVNGLSLYLQVCNELNVNGLSLYLQVCNELNVNVFSSFKLCSKHATLLNKFPSTSLVNSAEFQTWYLIIIIRFIIKVTNSFYICGSRGKGVSCSYSMSQYWLCYPGTSWSGSTNLNYC